MFRSAPFETAAIESISLRYYSPSRADSCRLSAWSLHSAFTPLSSAFPIADAPSAPCHRKSAAAGSDGPKCSSHGSPSTAPSPAAQRSNWLELSSRQVILPLPNSQSDASNVSSLCQKRLRISHRISCQQDTL